MYRNYALPVISIACLPLLRFLLGYTRRIIFSILICLTLHFTPFCSRFDTNRLYYSETTSWRNVFSWHGAHIFRFAKCMNIAEKDVSNLTPGNSATRSSKCLLILNLGIKWLTDVDNCGKSYISSYVHPTIACLYSATSCMLSSFMLIFADSSVIFHVWPCKVTLNEQRELSRFATAIQFMALDISLAKYMSFILIIKNNSHQINFRGVFFFRWYI